MSGSRLRRRELLAAGVGAGTAVLAGCTLPDPGPPEGALRIHHLDVGQADATLFETPADETVVVDTGDFGQNGQRVIDHLETLGIEHVDHLVATHAHADHIGGHAELIQQFETERDGIGLVYDSGVTHTTATYEEYIDAVEQHGHELYLVEEGDSLPVDGVEMFVLNPPVGDSGEDLDYNCVSLRVEHEGTRYLTTGDAGEPAEERMVSEWSDQLQTDIYQAGHHGSSSSSTEGFVDAADPDRSVISSAYDSQYGHPDAAVLQQFDTFDIETYWTGVHGETVLTVDSEGVTTDTGNSFSTDPLDILAAKPETAADSPLSTRVEGPVSTTAAVDRIRGGVAVLLGESGGETTTRSVVPVERLPPGAGEGTILSVTGDSGVVRYTRPDGAATEQRSRRIAERVERLSTPLSEVR